MTGKSTFKDYEVLTEAFEKKEMLKVFIKGMMFLEEQRTKGKFSLNVEDNQLFLQFSSILTTKLK